jgi:hypothetical protein
MLKISKALSFPIDALTQTFAILAIKRAGKSYTARRFAEQLLKAHQQVVIVDPKGDWWGIRSSADGTGPGYPVVIIGGERGDVPLEPNGGELVAKLVVEEGVSALLDLSLLRKHQVATFMTGFLETLYRLKAREEFRTPMMLVIDEADAIAPQKPQKGEERMLGAAEDIVRRGGQRGIGCMMVSQRSAVLNKNVLTQVEILIALRTIGRQDLDALNAWIEKHGTEERHETLMESLPSLPTGEAWVWSPLWPGKDGIFERVQILPIETFDSGATPKPGQRRAQPKSVADVDLAALTRQMAATIERAKAEDPRELQRQVRELKAELAKRDKQAPAAPKVDPDALKKAREDGAATARREFRKVIDPFCNKVRKAANDLFAAIPAEIEWGDLKEILDAVAPRKPAAIPRPSTPPRETKRPIRQLSENNGHLPEGERAILTAIAQHEGATKKHLTIITGYKRSTRDAYLQRLRGKGYVEEAGENVVATDAGMSALGEYEPLPTGDALREHWLRELPEGESKILRCLLESTEAAVSREALTEQTGYARSTRDAYIQRLGARKLVELVGRGHVAAAEELLG